MVQPLDYQLACRVTINKRVSFATNIKSHALSSQQRRLDWHKEITNGTVEANVSYSTSEFQV